MTLAVRARHFGEDEARHNRREIEAVGARIRDQSVAFQNFLDAKGVVSPAQE
jgi:hypothetical protein